MGTRPNAERSSTSILASNSKAGVVLALVCAASMWFYVERVLIPYQRADAVAHDRPRGNLSDLYPRWLGARELLLNHRNPYSPEVTREIQRGYYGRELDPRRPGDPIDQQAFAYPVYVAFLLAPTLGLPFEVVRVGFEWSLLGLAGASIWLWLRAIGWKPTPATAGIITLLALASFPVIQGLKLQQLTLLVAFLVAWSAALLARGRLFLAGVVMATATIKPQLVAPLLLCLLLWTVSDWARRQNFLWGFALALVALAGASQIVLPGWIGNFQSALRDYRHYAGGQSLLDRLLSPRFGELASVAVLLILVLVCWRFRTASAQSREFQYMLAVVLALTLVVIPSRPHTTRSCFCRGFFSSLASGVTCGHGTRCPKLTCALTVVVLGWAWAAALGLTVASLWLRPDTLERGWAIPLYTTLAIPIVVLIPLGSLLQAAWPAESNTSGLQQPC